MTATKSVPVLIVAAFCALAAGVTGAADATYWVANNGSDRGTNDGTESKPFLTLTNALAHAGDGDVVRIKAGAYDIPLAPGGADSFWATVDAAVMIEGVGGASKVFLDGGGNNVTPLKLNNAGATVRGITFRNFKTNSTWSKYHAGLLHLTAGTVDSCVFTDSSSLYSGAVLAEGGVVTNCVFRNVATRDGNSWGGGIVVYSGTPLVTDCLFDNCTARQGAAVYMQTAGTVRNCRMVNCVLQAASRGFGGTVTLTDGLVENCVIATNAAAIKASTAYPGAAGVNIRGGTVRNCLVADNSATGGTSGFAAGGVYLYDGTMENCTVAGNVAADVPEQGALQAGGTVRNCVIACNGERKAFADSVDFASSGGTVEYSCVHPLAEGTANGDSDPKFANAGAGDYALLPDTPYRNKALRGTWMDGAKDLSGRARVLGGGPEPGCYEVPGKGLVVFFE